MPVISVEESYVDNYIDFHIGWIERGEYWLVIINQSSIDMGTVVNVKKAFWLNIRFRVIGK